MVDKPIFELGKDIPGTGPGASNLGRYLCCTTDPERGSNQFIKLNFTAPPGVCSGLYYSLVFQLGKWGFFVTKVDEWIEVSPEHVEYYQRSIAQKQHLEGVIKTSLASAAQAVADYELVNHDLRKYQEILNYYTQKDEHALKAMFIDQVDIHTDIPNTPIALRSIVSRWPTVISDFIRIQKEEDIEPKKLGVSQAECVILKTKWKLYQEWKSLFRQAAIERYNHLKALAQSRKKTIEEYRKWLKPYLARFKMMRLGHERMPQIKETFKSFVDITGQATFGNSIKLYAWKALKIPEMRKAGVEKIGKFLIPPDDDFVKENFILNKEKGLAKIYPWLLDEKEKDGKSVTTAEEMINDILANDWTSANGLDSNSLYYILLDINVFRTGTKTPAFEIEDITFDLKNNVISQNIMLLKLLELKCREHELERYIDEILGMPQDVVRQDYPELFKQPRQKQWVIKPIKTPPIFSEFDNSLKALKKFSLPIQIFKQGSYEKDFDDRIPKIFLTTSGSQFSSVKSFLKAKMGIA